MNAPLQLEDFGTSAAARSLLFPAFSPSRTGADDDAQVAATEAGPEFGPESSPGSSAAAGVEYEAGYRAGWEDCDRMVQERRLAVAEELARSLQDLSFTYHEARSHVLALVAPVLRAMAEKLLPGLAEETFCRVAIAELTALAGEQAEGPITLLVAPASVGEVTALLGDAPPLTCEVVAEPSLGPFQACFRIGAQETLLDIDSVLTRIATATAALAAPSQRVLAHG